MVEILKDIFIFGLWIENLLISPFGISIPIPIRIRNSKQKPLI